ncbi:sigma-70 family RNA polymerase sigma factor [Hydromonas duriensis]|uniref:RNA polymerase sigma-70 factor (ECF subfamily) n=1 Tax=Hydromonas duriensis TaxID=1527608 RepID=A0A4V6PY40_9BURK|nr:sigma-70 family RNA polymerase sigma factor [Hydromonas duriensis]TDR31800.1 RNA polymerase sigma-70 factor (ECF subfamily) [Hydromonas duriensis]
MDLDNEKLQRCLTQLRPRLFNFASWQMGDKHAAEDITQDTLLAAYENIANCNDTTSLDKWVFSILRNKIVDYFRSAHKKRSINFSSLFQAEDENNDFLDHFFTSDGYWANEIEHANWSNPENCLQNKQFWAVLDACVNQLPKNMTQVFTMRAILELEAEEICDICQLTQANYWKILSRSRIGLQQCLTYRWFGEHK